jgi:hypothetical protein
MEKKQNKTEQKIEVSEADKIWNEIKNSTIDMFALPDQKVHQYVKQVKIDPSKLFLVASATSVLPSLETAIQGKFTVEQVDKFIVVKRK